MYRRTSALPFLRCRNRLIQELKSYESANRLLLTGTPLHNNLTELWSLLNFILPDIFDDLSSFQQWFDFSDIDSEEGHERILSQEQSDHIVSNLHAILKPFLLRRMKKDVEKDLPPKKELAHDLPMRAVTEPYGIGIFWQHLLPRSRRSCTMLSQAERFASS